MHIVVVSNNYPSKDRPNRGAFVYNLVQEFSKTHKVSVIAPRKLTEILICRNRSSYGSENCTVFRPYYLSVSNKRVFGMNLGALTYLFQRWAASRVLKKLAPDTDIVYCHFLTNAMAISECAKDHKLPIVVASGESQYDSLDIFRKEEIQNVIRNIRFIVCVSQSNFDFLSALGYPKNQMQIIPNAVDYDVFKPHDKSRSKKALGLTNEQFVIGFIGHFIKRKGPNRLIQAVDKISKKSKIKVVMVGSGGGLLKRDFILQIPPKPNHELPRIIGAFDIFVLPTLSEGHCNVIEEVKACGIPIISSKGTTVERQLNEQIGILVNPNSIEEIALAIEALIYDPQRRHSMTKSLYQERGTYTLTHRAEVICRILESITR